MDAEKTAVEINRENCNTDWRSTRPSMIDRFKRLCLCEEFSDVDFVFNKGLSNEIKIPAHSLILTLGSEVFEKLFAYDKKEEMKRQEIAIKDARIDVDTIRTLLKFIYSDFMDVADINSDTVLNVIYAAKLYMVTSLEKRCVNFLTKSLSENNVLEILDQCLKWTVNPELQSKCKEFLQKQTKRVLKGEKFLSISLGQLVILLEQEALSISEGELFESVLEWAKCACKAANIQATPQNIRTKLGPKAFSLIRFPTMSKEDFVRIVFPSMILTMQEQHDLMMMSYDDAQIENPPAFSKTTRKQSPKYVSPRLACQTGEACEITIVTYEDLEAHTGFELFDINTLRKECCKLKVEKVMTFHDLYEFVGSCMSLDPTEFRLWNFTDGRDYYTYIPDFPRPTNFVPYDPEVRHNNEDNDMSRASPPIDQVTSDHMIYMEVGQYSRDSNKRVLPKFDCPHEYLVFIKYYNHEQRRTEFKGILFFHQDRQLITYIPKLCPILGIPTDTKLNLYMEQRPDSIVSLQRNLPVFIRDFKVFFDGCIIVAEQSEKVTEQNNTKQYFAELYNRVEIEARLNVFGIQSVSNAFVAPFKGEIGLDWKLNKVCDWIGTEIDYDPRSILLWKVDQNTKKPAIPITDNTHFTVKELLNLRPPLYDPRTPRCYKLYYIKLPKHVADWELEPKRKKMKSADEEDN